MTFLKSTPGCQFDLRIGTLSLGKLPPNEKVQEFEPRKRATCCAFDLLSIFCERCHVFCNFSVTSPFAMRLDLAFFIIALPHVFNFIENLSISPGLLKQLKFLIPHSIQFTMQKEFFKKYLFLTFYSLISQG